MPIFEIQGPDGATYEVDAPDEASAVGAFSQMNAAPKKDQSYSGSILPFSIGPDGQAQFDSNAGLLGAIKRAVTLPRDVYEGKVDLNTDEATGRVLEAASIAAPVNPAIRAGDAAIPGALRAVRRQEVEPPSADALRAAADAGYDDARALGVDYSSNAVRDLAGTIQAGLERDGVLAELAPTTFTILNKLQNPPADSVASLSGLEAARRSFGHAAKKFDNPTEQLAAQRAREGLDTFLEGADPSSVVAGPAAEAARIMSEARGNYAAAARSDKLTGIEEAAELRAAAANSGQNVENATRQRIASLLLKPKERAGFSEAELAQLEKVVRGSGGANAARAIGNMLGGGGGLGAMVPVAAGGATGVATGSPALAAIGAALPVVGYGAKKVAARLTDRAFKEADEMTRMRSPLYERMQEEAPLVAVAPERRAAVVRALLAAQGIHLEE